MRKFILNVGHARKGFRNLSRGEIVRIMAQLKLPVEAIEVHQSNTETTSVVTLRDDGRLGLYGDIRQLAQATGQEVIAVWKPHSGKGVMLGATIDLDDAWGDFNPSLFIMPGGERLAPQLPAAA